MKIKDLPKQNRPRERFLEKGPEALSDAELFAIFLRTGTIGENVTEMSNRLIAEYGLDKLFDCSLKELQKIKGIGPSKAMQILSMSELGKRYNNSKIPIKKITCAEDVFNYFNERLKDKKEEHFFILMLNTQNIIIGEQLISKGILDASIIHPREVFKPAIKNSASKIILVHNHPSGDPKPSEEDLEITRRLMKTGEELGIKVLDGVIVGNGEFWSWKEKDFKIGFLSKIMNKKQLTEADIRTKFILPAIEKAGWDKDKQIREEKYFTAGRFYIYGKITKRGIPKKVDYILYHKNNIPIAVVEAKDNKHSVGDGLQQAVDYAEILDLPFAFSSNGDGFVLQDLKSGENKEFSLNEFPSPKELWEKYKEHKGITENIEDLITTDYYFETDWKEPRYYQRIAVNRTIEAIAKGKKRILLVMATGTGKTYTAFQTIWRLRENWKPKGHNPRVLYLADRNILVDDPMNKDLKPLKKVMTKVKNRKADKSYEVYMSLYQGMTGNEEEQNIYKQFSKDFFDLIIVDECHRGSARADSAWREILEYFSDAVQIGMTATPKETNKISNIDYFGDPIYTYSLKQGIDDGFLAPYRVIKVAINKDVHGYRPRKGELDKYGNEIPDYVYTNREFDRTLVIDERTNVVAKKITEFLRNTDRMSKTIVFCVDIEHAERMTRALINENKDLYAKNKKYVMRITGDNNIGKMQLDKFIDPAEKYPVIATTSKLMTTGVDAQTCKLIVLDSVINSPTEFKQIIGRGTRIREDYGKTHFTIMDFRNITNHFADPDFDGEPVQLMTFNSDEEIKPEEIYEKEILELEKMQRPDVNIYDTEGKVKKFYVKEADVSILNQSEQYLDSSGKLIADKMIDYTKKEIKGEYKTLNEFLNKWNVLDQKRALIDELSQKGIVFDCLREQIPNGKSYDPFDLILHVAYGQKPLTRSERAKKVKKDSYFDKYGGKARQVIDALLKKYSDEGIENLEDAEVLRVEPLNKFGRPLEIMKLFGGKIKYQNMIKELQGRLYGVKENKI